MVVLKNKFKSFCDCNEIIVLGREPFLIFFLSQCPFFLYLIMNLQKKLFGGVCIRKMAIGTSLSPQSAEVRFCNSDCSEVYDLIFGKKSVFGYPNVNGAGTTLPIIYRISETTWTISFPPRTVGRLWNRTPGEFRKVPTTENETDLGLYYYEGSLDIKKQ